MFFVRYVTEFSLVLYDFESSFLLLVIIEAVIDMLIKKMLQLLPLIVTSNAYNLFLFYFCWVSYFFVNIFLEFLFSFSIIFVIWFSSWYLFQWLKLSLGVCVWCMISGSSLMPWQSYVWKDWCTNAIEFILTIDARDDLLPLFVTRSIRPE